MSRMWAAGSHVSFPSPFVRMRMCLDHDVLDLDKIVVGGRAGIGEECLADAVDFLGGISEDEKAEDYVLQVIHSRLGR